MGSIFNDYKKTSTEEVQRKEKKQKQLKYALKYNSKKFIAGGVLGLAAILGLSGVGFNLIDGISSQSIAYCEDLGDVNTEDIKDKTEQLQEKVDGVYSDRTKNYSLWEKGEQYNSFLATIIGWKGEKSDRNSSIIDGILDLDTLAEYQSWLSVSRNGGAVTVGSFQLDGISGVLTRSNEFFITLGWGLCLIFWAYSFFEMLQVNNGQLVLEQVVKKLIMLVIADVVIHNAMDICFEITDVGTMAMKALFPSEAGLKTAVSADVDVIKEGIYMRCWSDAESFMGISFGDIATTANSAGLIMSLALPWLFSAISHLVVSMCVWGRAIEIILFAIISPLMFHDLGTTRDLTHSNTGRALKNLLSLALQGALILTSLFVCNMVMAAMITTEVTEVNLLSQAWNLSLIAFLKIGTVAKTNGLAKQVLGV